jgi:hypothetical protein
MINTLTFVELSKTLTHTRNEVDPLLDIFRGSAFWEFLNAPYGYFLTSHVRSSSLTLLLVNTVLLVLMRF